MAPEPRTRTRTLNFLSRASGKVCSAHVREVGRSSACVREFTNAEILVRLAREHFSCSARVFVNNCWSCYGPDISNTQNHIYCFCWRDIVCYKHFNESPPPPYPSACETPKSSYNWQ